MKYVYCIIWGLFLITAYLSWDIYRIDTIEKRKVNVLLANEYIRDKYTPSEIKKERERKNDEYIRQKFGKLWGIE